MKIRFSVIILIFFQCIFTVNSQSYTLYPNINPSIQLNQKIDNDHLILSNVIEIKKVNLYNRSTTEVISYKNDSKSAKIALDKLESSHYTVMVHDIRNNIIVLGVNVLNTLNDNDDLLVTNEIPKKDIQPKTKAIKKPKPKIKTYWAIREIKKHSGSTLSAYYYHNLDLMESAIKKNKNDLKSFSGKNNSLMIYEVYNRKDFSSVKFKLIQNYRFSKKLVLSKKERDAFNIIPFYKSNSENTQLSSVLK